VTDGGDSFGKWGKLLHRAELAHEATIPSLIRYARAAQGGNRLIAGDGGELTYAEADIRSRALALALLDRGVSKGTGVGILHRNGPEWVVSWLAVTRIGAVCVPLNAFAKSAELRQVMGHADLHAVITDGAGGASDLTDLLGEALRRPCPGPAERLEVDELPYLRHVLVLGEGGVPGGPQTRAALLERVEDAVGPSDPMIIIYTSGSSGQTKGVIHTHGAVLRHAADQRILYRIFAGDRVFTTMPFFWIGGFSVVLCVSVTAGATVLTQKRFDPGPALEMLERERATHVFAWPPALAALREQRSFDPSKLETVRLGLEWPGSRTDGAVRHGSLGMTETIASHSYSGKWDEDLPVGMAGSCGPAVPGIERCIVDPDTWHEVPEGASGELWVRGPNLTVGLYRREREEVFTPDGWYRTGDKARISDGCLFFEGRLDEMIKTSGSNVSPLEVQAALELRPGVKRAIVIGLPDDRRGQVVAACLVCEQPESLDLDAIRNSVAEDLSSFKVPRVLLALRQSEVPMLASGKVDRRLVALALTQVSEETARRPL
jgi:acyl-CoA synthetase (AMP-forming)/AMP-acid ligase II